jgi:ribonuclease G
LLARHLTLLLGHMKKIFINVTPWQTRVAITREDILQNIYFSSHVTERLERSYFLGVVTKVLPGIQTAFVEIGKERAGFLHISEIDRSLAVNKMSDVFEDDEEIPKPRSTQKPDIAKIVREGETLLVQVSKEPVNEKGAKLTTCFTLPGRFIVLMPNIPRIGISKKIESREERVRLKELLMSHLPAGMGAIIRTTSEEQNSQDILQDLHYLVSTWNTIESRTKVAKPKDKIYEDIDLSLQAVRDHLDTDVELVLVDDIESQKTIHKFVKTTAPEHAHKVKLYSGPPALFDRYNIENQIEQSLKSKVFLKSGASIVIESTEAMTVVDVNTGRFIGKTNLEETILKANMEAAEEVVRQLRLRNIGGLIVIDFIDMASSAHRQKLFRFFEKTLKEHDKFQSVVLKVSEFGLVQMTRKRSGKTLMHELMQNCDECNGLGFVKSTSNQAYTVLRALAEELSHKKKECKSATLSIHPIIFNFVTTLEYNAILDLEKNYLIKIMLISSEQIPLHNYKLQIS